jgi:hypothetical protein
VSTETINVWLRPKQCSAHPFYTLKVARQNFTALQTRNSRCTVKWRGRISPRALIFNAVIAYRLYCIPGTPRIAIMKIVVPVLLIALVGRFDLRADCHMPEPSAWCLLGLREGGWQFAVHLRAVCQGLIIDVIEE